MNRKIKRFEAKCALIIKFRSLGKFNLPVWAGRARSYQALTRLLFVSSQPSGKINFPFKNRSQDNMGTEGVETIVFSTQTPHFWGFFLGESTLPGKSLQELLVTYL